VNVVVSQRVPEQMIKQMPCIVKGGAKEPDKNTDERGKGEHASVRFFEFEHGSFQKESEIIWVKLGQVHGTEGRSHELD
jgi:hypothetical protein